MDRRATGYDSKDSDVSLIWLEQINIQISILNSDLIYDSVLL